MIGGLSHGLNQGPGSGLSGGLNSSTGVSAVVVQADLVEIILDELFVATVVYRVETPGFRPGFSTFHVPGRQSPVVTYTGTDPQADPPRVSRQEESRLVVVAEGVAKTQHTPTGLDPQPDPSRVFHDKTADPEPGGDGSPVPVYTGEDPQLDPAMVFRDKASGAEGSS